MKLTETLEAAFNQQVTLEFQASLVYRQLAIEMDIRDLPGIATWLRAQADEEIMHANMFIDHVSARGGHPTIGAMTAPEVEVETVVDVFESSYAHEQRVSEAIRSLYRVAEKEGDLDSRHLLNWFLNEQVEEEATVSEILGRLRYIANDGPGLLRLDEELGARTAAGTEPKQV